MRHFLLGSCLFLYMAAGAQTSISTLNFIQAGAVPKMLKDKGRQFSNSGATFNFSSFNTKGFYRMDATWLFRKLFHGKGDSTTHDSSFQLAGMDLPVFTATFGRNFVANQNFSIGLGINLDSRTLFADPSAKSKAIIDAINTGIVIGVKVRIHRRVTYSGLIGYDFMFSNNKQLENGRQYYTQNNISVLFFERIGFNIQPDISIKSFDLKGMGNASLVNKNIKVGISYAIP